MAVAGLTTDDSYTNIDDKELELFCLIWLDANANAMDARNTEQKLRSIINHLKKFRNVEQCQEYIEQRSQKDRLVLIVSGQLGREIVPSIHKFRQVISIYVYCMDKKRNEQWACKFKKVKAVTVELDELISRIRADHKIQKKVEEPLSINFFAAGKSTTGVNGEFVFSQVLIDCLLRLKSTQTDRNELVNLCQKQYEGNSDELSNIHEFEVGYSPNKALWWYTRESFFYKTLNAALRKSTIHTIFLFRSFISDIHRQLQKYQSKKSLRVYRSQMISSDELKTLKQSLGQLISVNSFFSTSTDYARALSFLEISDASDDLERILFEIDADPKMVTTKPFADISAHSEFGGESEVLFMLGSIFRLETINRNNDDVWIIRMTLCSDDENDLKQVLMYMKQQIGNGDTNLQTLGKILWDMGKFELAEKYFVRLLKELPPNDPSLSSLYEDLGKVSAHAGNYDMSIQWHQKSLELKNKHQPVVNPTVTKAKNSTGITAQPDRHPTCQFRSNKPWFDRQLHEDETIKKPDELEQEMEDPPGHIDRKILDRIHGSMIGMALGDALGASVEYRPHSYMVENPVTKLEGGGTWGLKRGQFTDDTSMGLCLANSLVSRRNYVPYDQLVRYKWWHKDGYMSSTGNCFDIDAATKNSLVEFERRQKKFAKAHKIPFEEIDYLSDRDLLKQFDVNCSEKGVAGNGALMRLAPVPLFFYRDPIAAVEYSGQSGEITHGDKKAYDACRYYGALIVAAVNGESREKLLDKHFYEKHKAWFGDKPLHSDIMKIAHGSYQRKKGYNDGIRGKGYIVSAVEAALWAFWSEKTSFEKGALAAVNLGDDTDTTAAIYGQLAGAYYGFSNLPERWKEKVYAKGFIECLSKWIVYEGEKWSQKRSATSPTPTVTVESPSQYDGVSPFEQETNASAQSASVEKKTHGSELPTKESNKKSNSSSKFEQSTNSGSSGRLRRSSMDATPNLRPNAHQQSVMARPGSAEHDKKILSNDDVASCDEVCKWVRKLGKEYAVYADVFERNNVDGYWLLNYITDKDLEGYGITNEAHRQFILDKIEKLKRKSKATTASNKK